MTNPADMVLNVMNAADPAAVRAADMRLQAVAGSAAPPVDGEFTSALESDVVTHLKAEADEKAATPASYRKFEAMVLQSFVQSMLPQDSEALYGKGTAGNIWKGMLAEHLGSALADRGGIGIADRLMNNAGYDDSLDPLRDFGSTS